MSAINPLINFSLSLFENAEFIERVVVKLLDNQLRHGLFEGFQSGSEFIIGDYHSTKTALMKVTNDLLIAFDNGLISVLLDLSTMFN